MNATAKPLPSVDVFDPFAKRWHITSAYDHKGHDLPEFRVLHVRTARGTGRTACSATVVSLEMLTERRRFAHVLWVGRRRVMEFRKENEGDRSQ